MESLVDTAGLDPLGIAFREFEKNLVPLTVQRALHARH